MSTTVYTRENPSPRFRTLENIYRQVHEAGLPAEDIEAADLFAGTSLLDHIPRVKALAQRTGAQTILDYGAGKGVLYKRRDLRLRGGDVALTVQQYWGVREVLCFDPGVAEFSSYPTERSDGVICTDVLEHIPEEDVPWLLAELFRLANRFVYANIASFPAAKTLPNGWNAHVTIRPPDWWAERFREAAEGWKGEAYEFQVLEKRGRLMRLARKVFGFRKRKSTTIAARRNAVGSELVQRSVAGGRA